MTDRRDTRLSVLFIFATLTLNSMGVGLILPVMPDLIRDVTGGDIAEAAGWGGILATSYAVMQFLFAPTVGALSDRFGRRPVLLVSLAVLAADYVVLALAGSIWLLLAARLVGGITSATQSTAAALISDLSTPEDKARNFGLLGAAFGIGFVFGPVIGGLLAEFGTRAPFWVAAGLASVNLIFGASVLKETVTDEIRRPFDLRRSNPFSVFAKLREMPSLLPLLTLFFLYEFAFLVFPSTWAYFTQARFGWDTATVGLSLATFGIAMAAVQGGLIGIVLRRLGETRTIVWGFLFNTLTFALLAVVGNGTAILLLAPLSALGAVVTPALQSRIANTVAVDSQGEVQGLLASVRAVAMIFSPLVMTQTFRAFSGADAVANVPGAAFLLAMGLMIVALLINASLCRAAPASQSA
ncbi:TCR/Tet family MFS transporter [Tropicimonas marinistellae]|uniref:TCR/Tet family MFS transporter n=1 Tax=Tropicimonas marinistellae TaxID=1739787 RepID=UPI00082D4679|nr:TCR/Tet family MFS transporter [Tropicimonas marinistellae]